MKYGIDWDRWINGADVVVLLISVAVIIGIAVLAWPRRPVDKPAVVNAAIVGFFFSPIAVFTLWLGFGLWKHDATPPVIIPILTIVAVVTFTALGAASLSAYRKARA